MNLSFVGSLFGILGKSATPLDRAMVKLLRKEPLLSSEMSSAMEAIMSGKESDERIERFLASLRDKGETAAEIASAARVMRQKGLRVRSTARDLLDTCGTGGDRSGTFNVSTLAAIVACSAGAHIAKHGNRSVSSVCGSADVLEELGVKVDLEPAQVERCLDETGFGFMFAPRFHPAVRFAMPARKKMGGKTIFNLIGPLSNPADAPFQLLGVYDPALVETFARVLVDLGTRRALVVHGEDGLDEVTLTGKTLIAEVQRGAFNIREIVPEDFGYARVKKEELVSGSRERSIADARLILSGAPGPKTDLVCLNAGAALFVVGLAPSFKEGAAMASRAIQNGAAGEKLMRIASVTQKLGAAA